MKSSKEHRSLKQSRKPQLKKQLNRSARFSGIAFQMAATIFVGTFIGVKLDEKYPNENNLYTIIFSLVFVLASLYLVVKRVSNFSNKKDD